MSDKPKKEAFTKKQKLFVDEYFKCKLNATHAAKAAGFSERRAGEIGYQLLKKPHVKEAVEKRMLEYRRGNQEAVDRVLHELSYMAYEAGVKDTDKLKALELIGKYHAMFTDKVETNGTLDIVIGMPEDMTSDNSE